MTNGDRPTMAERPDQGALGLASLTVYAVLDTLPEPDLDDIVRPAARFYGFELLHKPYSVEQLSRLLRKVAT